MNSKFIKLGCFIAVPSLYLYYFISKKQHSHYIHAYSNDSEPKLFIDKVNGLKLNENKKFLTDDLIKTKLEESKSECQNLIETFRVINNVPGAVCGVSYKGEELYAFGQGLADIETKAKCDDDTIMRIASISKSITMLLLGKLLEQNKLDLDKSISHYLNEDKWPTKYFEKKKVDITLRQLCSHLSGVRSYKLTEKDTSEFDSLEYYITKHYDNVYEALTLFKDDDLKSEPGTKYLYSTFGFTLLSAVIQSVLEKDQKFETELIKLLRNELQMYSTYLDVNETIIPNRAKYYDKGAKNQLINVPEIDNSYKIAGGGLLSDVHDLLKFGNAILYSYKTPNGILKQETVKQFWTPNPLTSTSRLGDILIKYGMGFSTSDHSQIKYKSIKRKSLNDVVFHIGGAVGVTSILLIYPQEEIVIAIMVNLKACPGIGSLATKIAKSVYQNLEEINRIN